MRRLVAALAALLLLAGCASLRPAADETAEVVAMLARYDRLATLKGEELRHEFSATQEAHDRAPSDSTRLHLALAMLLPRAPWRDEGRVLLLLGAVAAAPGEQRSPRRDLAQFLLTMVTERQRTQHDEQRKLDQLGSQLREERRKGEDMRKKIESLLSIDKDMRTRRREP